MKDGNILISAHSETSAEISKAKDIFTAAGASDISSTSESSAPSVTTKVRGMGQDTTRV